MDYQSSHILTLANSIIGVSILAMPYCFKQKHLQCGIILSTLIILISSIISRLAGHFLLKSAILARRKTFEFLAFHTFGSLGKFAIEIGLIGFLLGTCVAFFVVMGDLGPEIVSEITEKHSTNTTRTTILIFITFFCVLPLGLLRNIDSLDGVSKATIGFYCCLVLKIIAAAFPHIFVGDWFLEVNMWRPAGILQCLPIFSMALFCQTQLFEIYQALPNVSLEKMNNLIRIAVNICTWVYIFVGIFGYIAFFKKPFTGNILSSFEPSIMTDVIKIGFVLSLAFSFPLIIFPCRASLYSLLFKENSYILHDSVVNYIPENKFKLLTFIIVIVSLIIGISIPNIELVLGLIGSTIGVMICVLFPVTCFICISPKNTNERILAQIMLFIGIIVMVLGTYANLYAFEEAQMKVATENAPQIINLPLKKNFKNELKEIPLYVDNKINAIPTTAKINVLLKNSKDIKEVRHEPPQPVEPVENKPKEPNIPERIEKMYKPNTTPFSDMNIVNNINKEDIKNNKLQVPVSLLAIEKTKETKEGKDDLKSNEIKNNHINEVSEKKKNDEVDIEAIKKEDTELKEQENEKDEVDDEKHKILIETIKHQNELQQQMFEQQQKLIKVIEQQQQLKDNEINKRDIMVNEEKVKAVKQIEHIARKAIETISGQDAINEIPQNQNRNKTRDILKKILDTQVFVNKSKNIKDSKINLVPLPIAQKKLLNFTNDVKKEEALKKKNDIKNNTIIQNILLERTNKQNSEINIKKKENPININEGKLINVENILKENNPTIQNENNNQNPEVIGRDF